MRKLLVRLYPRAWRERYGNELLALLEQLPVTPVTMVDLLGGAAAARWQQGGAWAAGVRRASRLRVLWWMASVLALAAVTTYLFGPDLVTSPSLVRRVHAAIVMLAALLTVTSMVADGPQSGSRSTRTDLTARVAMTAWLSYVAVWALPGSTAGVFPRWIFIGVVALGLAIYVVFELRRAARRLRAGL